MKPIAPLASPAAALVALIALALAACASSPPTQFYSLSAVPGQSAASPPQGGPLQVAAVHIPPILDRREIVREGAGDRLIVNGEQRWGAPFDEMVQHVLTQDLVERLPAGAVVLPGGPTPKGTGDIVVDLLQFQSDASGTVVLQGSWSLLPGGQSNPTVTRSFRYQESANAKDAGDLAGAMSRLLGRVADDIAHEVATSH
jgi:uncharacterized protein